MCLCHISMQKTSVPISQRRKLRLLEVKHLAQLAQLCCTEWNWNSGSLCSCPRVAISTHYKPRGLNNRNRCLTALRSEVWNQGVCQTRLPLKAVGETPSSPLPAPRGLSPQFAAAALQSPPLSPHDSPGACVSTSELPSVYTDTSHWVRPL